VSDKQADERNAHQCAAGPYGFHEADDQSAAPERDSLAHISLQRRVEHAFSKAGQEEPDEDDPVPWKQSTGQHSSRQRTQAGKEHDAIPPSIGHGTKQNAQESGHLIDGNERGDRSQRNAQSAAESRRIRVGEASSRVEKKSTERRHTDLQSETEGGSRGYFEHREQDRRSREKSRSPESLP
jgi:hypothetical protein